jgi:hypothetical protein
MAYFQIKNPNLDKFAMADLGTSYGHLAYFMAVGIFYGHLPYFVVVWYFYPILVRWTKKNLATLPQG